MNRREFIKTSLLASGALALSSCIRGGFKTGSDTQKAMEMRTDSHGTAVSLLGYGCMRWPTIPPQKGQEDKREIDQEMVNRLVDYALENGVNYFDTAPVYCQGQSEKATATALLRHPRNSYLIATKLSNQNGDKTLSEGQKMFENSLSIFQTDYIDYLLLHNLGGEEAFKERFLDNGLLDWLMEQRKKGRIRNLGFSFHGAPAGFDAILNWHEKVHWDFVQIQMNYIDWKHAGQSGSWQGKRAANAEYLYGKLAEIDIPVVIMEPLLGGRLANLPEGPTQRLKKREPELSVASWAFRFSGSFPKVLTILSGMTYMEHLQDNIETFSHFRPLSEEDKSFLEETARMILNFPLIDCTDCQYCMPCPYGINIPRVFAHYNHCVNEDYIPQDSTSKDYREKRRAYLIHYDRIVPRERQAGHCIQCGECLKHCPQQIDIPKMMQKIDRYTEKLRRENPAEI